MRLAAVPIACHTDPSAAREIARASSFTTHPGCIASEACAFLANLIANLIATSASRGQEPCNAAQLLMAEADAYIRDELSRPRESVAEERAVALLRRLLNGADEPTDSTERCWNWRQPSLELRATLENRGSEYNGYPNSAGYFGSYSLDGLAMALWAVAHTSSFGEAIEACVNLCGDADTTGAIAGQIAGALYGYRAIPSQWRDDLIRWDDYEVALRAALLARLERAPQISSRREGLVTRATATPLAMKAEATRLKESGDKEGALEALRAAKAMEHEEAIAKRQAAAATSHTSATAEVEAATQERLTSTVVDMV